jgi:hypothetical protein
MKSESGNREWLDEFMSLKQVDPKNPFTVPPGYFDELEQRITSAIKLEELKSDKGFTVPENYFDELSNNIQSRINIEAYVNNDAHGHAVPQDYFLNLEQQINARILVEETIGEEEHFTVPADYFDKLNKAILNKTVNQEIVKRKGIVRRMLSPTVFKYAAAASVLLVIGTGLLLNQPAAPIAHNSTFLHKQLSTVSTSDIQSYLQDDVDANDTQHTVIDENAPVNDASLNNALQDYNDTNN